MGIFLKFDDTDDDVSNDSSSGNGPVLTWRNGEVVWEVKNKLEEKIKTIRADVSDLTKENNMSKEYVPSRQGWEWWNEELKDVEPRVSNGQILCSSGDKLSWKGGEAPSSELSDGTVTSVGGNYLKLTSDDQFCVFKDGDGDEWEILDFFSHRDYEVHARSRSGDVFEDFNQFGKRKGFKLDSPCSLKSKTTLTARE